MLPELLDLILKGCHFMGRRNDFSTSEIANRYAGSKHMISQSAADQGSRTGIKGSGILSSININGGGAEPAIGKQKFAICVPEPGSSSPLRLLFDHGFAITLNLFSRCQKPHSSASGEFFRKIASELTFLTESSIFHFLYVTLTLSFVCLLLDGTVQHMMYGFGDDPNVSTNFHVT
ncbi:hypothetical protein L6452_17215 [Arctium lappa]|uniref:Uncharacterized protein n=1 Tax=Arctium lappa TaxID=4217 RepID=A0ACB9C335_ARCLA|nr:hypothetical protein L6452_17215 [Arctium lappa]